MNATRFLLCVYLACAASGHTVKQAKTRREMVKQVTIRQMVSQNLERTAAEIEAEKTLAAIQDAKRAVLVAMGYSGVEPHDDGLWQGDIILTKEQAERITAFASGKLEKRDSLFFENNPATRWPSKVMYTIDPSLDSASAQLIMQTLKGMSTTIGCITFAQLTAQPAAGSSWMRFQYDKSSPGRSCQGSAHIGMGVGENGINIDVTGCMGEIGAGIIIHEVMHSLGFGHEHTRRDRDNFVTIDINNVQTDQRHNFYQDNSAYSNYGTSYDFKSIMHYQYNIFALNPSKPTMVAKVDAEKNRKLMGNSHGMQAGDTTLVKRAYCLGNPMKLPVQYTFSGLCSSIGSSCPSGPLNIRGLPEAPACPAGSTQSRAAMKCMVCDIGESSKTCTSDGTPEAAAYLNYAKGSTSYCPGGSKAFVFNFRECKNASPDKCLDTRIDCGDDARDGKCSQAAVSKACPKSCAVSGCTV